MNQAATVLCVSEDLCALHEIVGTLQASGYRAIIACSYPRAVMLAAAEKIDVVVIAQSGSHSICTNPASLKFVRPQLPIVLVTSQSNELQPTAGSFDMVARRIPDVPGTVRSLLETAPRKSHTDA